MGALHDYYRILHVQPDAPTAVIHASYRTLLTRALGRGDEREQVILLDEAYAVLGDAQRRAQYDAARTVVLAAPSTAVADGPAETRPPIGELGCLLCGAPHPRERGLERDDECTRCASPLFPAERHRLEYSGQRMLARVPKHRLIEVRVTWPQPEPFTSEMRDLSLNGMLFIAPMPLQLNQIVRIDCKELRALARVAHKKEGPAAAGGWVTGVEFLTLRFWQLRGAFISAKA